MRLGNEYERQIHGELLFLTVLPPPLSCFMPPVGRFLPRAGDEFPPEGALPNAGGGQEAPRGCQ